MPDTICAIHSEPMRQFWKKEDTNHTGQSWFSHKLENGEWCNGKPKEAKFNKGYTQPKTVDEYNGKPQEFWDIRSNVIALCGMVNAAIGAGKEVTPTLIDSYGKTLKAIQKKAEELKDIPF